MRIKCPKCKRKFDPAIQMAQCTPRIGHAPVKATDQNLTEALLVNKEHVRPREKFQSDFRLIWQEPLIQIKTRR